MSSTTFTLFPLLPSEIRLKIWEFIAPGPRTVRIQYHVKHGAVRGRKDHPAFNGWISPDPVPVVLHVCREARAESLKRFEVAFGNLFHDPSIYLNFSTDVVRFGNDRLVETSWLGAGAMDYLLDVLLSGGYHGADDTDKIQFMSIDIHEDLYDRRNFCWDEIRLFRGLKGLTMMAWDESSMADALMSHYRVTLAAVASAHPEWIVPKISVFSGVSNEEWGVVAVTTSEHEG